MKSTRLALVLLVLGACEQGDEPQLRPSPGSNGGSSTGLTMPAGSRAPGGRGTPWFADVTAQSGVDFRHAAGRTAQKHLPEAMGHGGALTDVDHDGDLDLYLVQGGPLGPHEASRERPRNALFSNRGDGTFEDASSASGAAHHPGYGMGVAAGDADGDGHVDLFVTNRGPDALLAGDGRGGFTEVTSAGLADERWTSGAAFFDADLDGDLDLYVAAYVEVDLANPVWCGRREEGWRTVCHPDQYPGLQDRFWRNSGGGSFQDETQAAGLADSFGKGLGVIATDLDADGWPDLYVANDSVENRLWRNLQDGRFVDETLMSGTGVNGFGATEAGMGLASGDLDGDGDFELYVTNFDNESHTLYVNEGDFVFEDRTAALGLDAPTRLLVGFGVLMQDLDDDGDLDLCVANGHIVDRIELYHDGQSWAQPAQLFLNDGRALFRDVSALCGDWGRSPRVGRGLFSGDLDGDGDLDLVATECGGPTRIFQNTGAGGRAVLVDGAPRGARLIARRQDGVELIRECGPQPSYLSQTAERVHLGLGAAEGVRELLLAFGGRTQTVHQDGLLGPGLYQLLQGEGGRWSVRASK